VGDVEDAQVADSRQLRWVLVLLVIHVTPRRAASLTRLLIPTD